MSPTLAILQNILVKLQIGGARATLRFPQTQLFIQMIRDATSGRVAQCKSPTTYIHHYITKRLHSTAGGVGILYFPTGSDAVSYSTNYYDTGMQYML